MLTNHQKWLIEQLLFGASIFWADNGWKVKTKEDLFPEREKTIEALVNTGYVKKEGFRILINIKRFPSLRGEEKSV